ncbi:RNA polymerase sigma factor [Nocardia sp. BMG51109]|uniref:RNA polymerase sigma factor n=1 Tax=Nocardia sp. BMG51109 TaxID=1056816 RepID=UPI0004635E59|nr:sigma-70 family RNA polymerase sigma factor [Nocardia sp. BMG51109]
MSSEGTLPPDDVLADRLRTGDEQSFELVLDAWSASMLRLARSFVSSEASAEEVVQETWLAVIRGVGNFEGRSSLKTWVFRILVNTAKKRGVKESRTIPFGSLTSDDEGATVDPGRFRPAGDRYPGHWLPGEQPERWSEPENAAEHSEVLRIVGAAVATLADRSRIVITLRDVEGYSSEEVCEMLDISPGNQRVILHRARAIVRAALEEYFAAERSVRP